MKAGFKALAERFIGSGVVLSIILVLLFPASSVLCIAPGSHVAVEDINAPCCSSVRYPSIAVKIHHYESELTGNCGDCIDLLIADYGREAIQTSDGNPGTGLRAIDFWGIFPEEMSSLQSRHFHVTASGRLATSFSSSLPLRC